MFQGAKISKTPIATNQAKSPAKPKKFPNNIETIGLRRSPKSPAKFDFPTAADAKFPTTWSVAEGVLNGLNPGAQNFAISLGPYYGPKIFWSWGALPLQMAMEV